jgi:soluble lytic murein transglycosylase-like protein
VPGRHELPPGRPVAGARAGAARAGIRVALGVRVVPTVHDVRGHPVPGISGVPPLPVPPAGANGPFRLMLDRLLAPKPSAAVQRPVAVPRRIPASELTPPVFPRAGVAPQAAVRVTAPESPDWARPVAEPGKRALAESIRSSARTAGVDPALSVAVARAESNLDPGAKSSDGRSAGTFQVLPTTAAEMRRKIAAGTVERPAGTDDVALGVGYLRYLHDLFGRDAKLARGLHTVAVEDAGQRRLFAVAAFNAGEGRVARAQAKAAAAGGDPTRFADVAPYLPQITQRYVPRVLAYARAERAATVTV